MTETDEDVVVAIVLIVGRADERFDQSFKMRTREAEASSRLTIRPLFYGSDVSSEVFHT